MEISVTYVDQKPNIFVRVFKEYWRLVRAPVTPEEKGFMNEL
jgi:hypothetical protein